MMDEDFAKRIQRLPVGKKIKDAVYLHRESISMYDADLWEYVKEIGTRYRIEPHFNVVKIRSSGEKISFLSYPDFDEDPHPQLAESAAINLSTGKIGRHDYRQSSNPPILHRKENLVGPKHPLYSQWTALTENEESEGLYDDPTTIGLKKYWDYLLAQKGLCYDGDRLIRGERDDNDGKPMHPAADIPRHKTAIKRYTFSKPVQGLLEYGLLKEGKSFFDYGCGKGDDVRGLKALGHDACGWDPVHPSDNCKIPADIVNLGFVLNVIEDPQERADTLREAFSLTKGVLSVSTLVATSSTAGLGTPYRDGILTRRNTFQKYFRQEELRQYIESVLEVEPTAVGLGIFYVFRSPQDQEEFLSSRRRSSVDWENINRRLLRERKRDVRPRSDQLFEKHRDLFEGFWGKMLELGRLPTEEELPEGYKQICRLCGSVRRAKKLFVERYGEETLQESSEQRKNDLLVHLALSNFKKKVSWKHIPAALQTDIKTFFGSYAKANEESRKILYAIANSDLIARLCDETPFGVNDYKAFYVHKSLVPRLHPVLRTYSGCAEVLFGDLRNADVVKIHKRSGKVTFHSYDDFENQPLPELQIRIKVNLRTQSIDIFDHQAMSQQQLLYFKERYVAPEHPRRQEWEQFSERLRSLGLHENMGFGPTKQELLAFINGKGMDAEDFLGTEGSELD